MERKFPQKSINPICNNIFLTFSIKRGGDLVSKYDDKEENKKYVHSCHSFIAFYLTANLQLLQKCLIRKVLNCQFLNIIVSASLSILLRAEEWHHLLFLLFEMISGGLRKGTLLHMSYKYACKYRTNGIKRSNKLTFNLQVHNYSCVCCHF